MTAVSAAVVVRSSQPAPSGVRSWSTADRRNAVVVANAAECEPASFKDRTLTGVRPHLVLDGLEHAAETVGARRAVVYTCRSHDGLLEIPPEGDRRTPSALGEQRVHRGARRPGSIHRRGGDGDHGTRVRASREASRGAPASVPERRRRPSHARAERGNPCTCRARCPVRDRAGSARSERSDHPGPPCSRSPVRWAIRASWKRRTTPRSRASWPGRVGSRASRRPS